MNTLNNDLLSKLSELYSYTLLSDDWYNEKVKMDEATSILIGFELDYEGSPVQYIGKEIKLPKKKNIDINWFMNKLRSQNIFLNFSEKFKKIINSKYPNTFNVYPTSYGIGISLVFRRGRASDEIKVIKKQLDSMGIQYTTGFSDAMWVYRFKISKSSENIKLIDELF